MCVRESGVSITYILIVGRELGTPMGAPFVDLHWLPLPRCGQKYQVAIVPMVLALKGNLHHTYQSTN